MHHHPRHDAVWQQGQDVPPPGARRPGNYKERGGCGAVGLQGGVCRAGRDEGRGVFGCPLTLERMPLQQRGAVTHSLGFAICDYCVWVLPSPPPACFMVPTCPHAPQLMLKLSHPSVVHMPGCPQAIRAHVRVQRQEAGGSGTQHRQLHALWPL